MTTDKEETRGSHPGWAVQCEDGYWIGCAHGVFMSEDAFYASIFNTEEEAREFAEEAQEEFVKPFNYNIVLAWQPLCEKLRLECNTLRKISKIDWGTLWEVCQNIRCEVDKIEEAFNAPED